VGGSAPDIIWNTGQPAGDYYKNKWIIDLTSYYSSKSPYTGQPWQDSFREGLLQGVKDPNLGNAMLGMPIAIVSVNLYYNKDIFKAVGLDPNAPPQSWGQVLADARKVKDSGMDYVPYSVQNSISWNLGWMEGFIMDQLWWDVVPKLDIITKNGSLENSEQALGVRTGVVDPADPRMVDFFRFMKEMAKYFNKGFNAASWEYEGLFNTGKAAMNLNGSWFPSQVVQNKITLNYGATPMPYVDSTISRYAYNKPKRYAVGMGSAEMVVTQRAKDGGRADAAVDFLRYLTDPKTGAKAFAEAYLLVPVVKGVQLPDVVKAAEQGLGTDLMSFNWQVSNFTPEENSKYRVALQTFLEDATAPEAFVTQYKEIVMAGVDQVIKDHPEWKVDDYVSKVSK
jgi:ABC-type glycerol-3-phosphate transport system substrate-binding protein